MHQAGDHGERPVQVFGKHTAPEEQVEVSGRAKLPQRWQRPLSGHVTRISSGIVSRFGDGYMITVRTRSSSNVKDVVRFFSRNFPQAVLKVRSRSGGTVAIATS